MERGSRWWRVEVLTRLGWMVIGTEVWVCFWFWGDGGGGYLDAIDEDGGDGCLGG